MTLRLPEDVDRALELLARDLGVSKHEATVRAIKDAAERRGRQREISELSAEGMARYEALLKRLGE